VYTFGDFADVSGARSGYSCNLTVLAAGPFLYQLQIQVCDRASRGARHIYSSESVTASTHDHLKTQI
jgi:hypothetical protein